MFLSLVMQVKLLDHFLNTGRGALCVRLAREQPVHFCSENVFETPTNMN